MKIDAFAHILPPKYYQDMLEISPEIPTIFPFIKIKNLIDLTSRLKQWPNDNTKQAISLVNISPEDFCKPNQAAHLSRKANDELAEIVFDHSDKFEAGVGVLPMNNIDEAIKIVDEIVQNPHLIGAQIFTRHLGKSIADPEFRPVLAKAAEANLPLWLHPVFDQRKPDNNLVFSWEYELSQAMLQLVESKIFEDYPNLKILVHHAGAMVPFFAERINHILPNEEAKCFKNFYVDTAILGNTPALQLAIDYYGLDHVLFGTDAPFAVPPSGANAEVSGAINNLAISKQDKQKIFSENFVNFLKT